MELSLRTFFVYIHFEFDTKLLAYFSISTVYGRVVEKVALEKVGRNFGPIKRVIIKYGRRLIRPYIPNTIPWKIYFSPNLGGPHPEPVKYNLVPRLLLLTLPSPPRSIQPPGFLV